MNEIQKQLLALSRRRDISGMGYRALARELGVKNPQTIKYHLGKLHEAGHLNFEEKPTNRIELNALGQSHLITIPVMGAVSAGPPTQEATNQVSGYIKVSSALLRTRNYKDLFALKVSGLSMNKAEIDGKRINDGDYAIIDRSKKSPKNGDRVVALLDGGLATLKRFVKDEQNQQIVLVSESSEDYMPIFVDPSDDSGNLIQGTVVRVIHQPSFA